MPHHNSCCNFIIFLGRYPQCYHDFVNVRLSQKTEKNLKLAEEAKNSNLSKTSLSTTADSSYSTDENMAPKSLSTRSAAEYNPSAFFEPPKLVASSGTATLTHRTNNYSTYQNTAAPTFNSLGTATPNQCHPNDYSTYQNTGAPTLNAGGVGTTTPAHHLYDYSTYQNQAGPTFNNVGTYRSNDYSTYQNPAVAAATTFNNLGTTTLTHHSNDPSPYETLVPTFNNLALATPRSNSSYSTYQNMPPTTFSTSSNAVPPRIFPRKLPHQRSSPAAIAASNLASRCPTGSDYTEFLGQKLPSSWSKEQSMYYLPGKLWKSVSFDSSYYLPPPPPVMPPVSRPNLAFRNVQPINQSLDTSYNLDHPSTAVQAARANPLPLVRVTLALDLFKKKVEEIVQQNCIDEDLSISKAEVDALVTKLCKEEFIVHHNLGGSLQHIQMTENISGRLKNRLNRNKYCKAHQENAKEREEEDANEKAKEFAKKKAAEETAKKEVDAAERRIVQQRLFDAIASRDLKSVEFCLQNGANVNCSLARGNTPLHTAAACGNFEILQILLQNGADVNAKDEAGFTPMDVMTLAAAEETERRIA